MSTTPIDTWAVDLADVTFIYPFVGSEGLMAIIGIVLWLLWHVWQARFENRTYEEEKKKYGNTETIRDSMSE